MRVVRLTSAGRSLSHAEIFTGEVDGQTAVGGEISKDLRLSE